MSNTFILDEGLFNILIYLVIIVTIVYMYTKTLNTNQYSSTSNNYVIDYSNKNSSKDEFPEFDSCSSEKNTNSCSSPDENTETESEIYPPPYPSFPDKSYPKYTNPIVYERDRLELEDPLYPPEQRSDNDIENRYLQMAYNGYFRNPTRGYPPPYQMKGYLVQDDNDTNVLSLFGRPKYVGSTQYDYYFSRNDINNNEIKLPIKHQRELLDGDIIKLHTGIYNGEYKYVALPVEDLIQPPLY